MHLTRELQSFQQRFQNVKKRAAEESRLVVDAGITGGAAFGFAYVQGRYPTKAQIGTVPLSLVVGGGLIAASVMKWMPASSASYASALGTGALAAYAAERGFAAGQNAANKASGA